MSARPQRLRTPRPLSIAAAADMVPRQLVDTDAPKRPKNYLGRASAEMKAEHQSWLDLVPTRASCLHCPGWSSEGTAAETRQASLAHRTEVHPGTLKRVSRAQKKAKAVAEAEKRRKANETAAPGLLSVPQPSLTRGANGWASGEGNEPGTGAAVLEKGAAVGQTAVSSSAPAQGDLERAASSSSSALANPYGLERSGRGFTWTRAAAIRAVQDYAATVGIAPGQNASRGEPVGTLPSLTAARSLFGGWAGLVEAAGFARPAWGGTRVA